MRKSMIAAGAGLLMFGTAVYAQVAEDAFGTWLNPENKSHTQFYKCGEGLCAKIVKSGDGQKTDDKNPDPAKRNRPIEGLVIMENAKKSGTNKWTGSLYNRADGKTYSGTVTVKSKSELDLQGCAIWPLCSTRTFTRVN
jgi:uncharacterized protein (DUF2147 family)